MLSSGNPVALLPFGSVVDLHFHLLPGLDDGPADMEQALGLARAAVAAGTTTVVATPHVSWRWPDNDALQIADGVLLLRRHLQAESIALDVRRGAEVALTRAVDLPGDELQRLGLGGGPWLLLECPRDGGAAGTEVLLTSLAADGHRLLLAHPERIRAFREDPMLCGRLVREGMRCQVTAGALVGRFGRDVQRFARWLLEEGHVHVVASDAHAFVQWLVRESPTALLAGAEPPTAPATYRRRSRLRRARCA